METKSGGRNWLMAMLERDDWWIRAIHAQKVWNLLGIEYGEPSYYRDVVVWLPQVRWGPSAMPCCPSCLTLTRVGQHAWRENHIGRRICNMTIHYFALTARYICHGCKELIGQKNNVARAAAENLGLQFSAEAEDDGVTLSQYTFMGWDQRSLPLLPHCYSQEFPAFLTWRGGLDKVSTRYICCVCMYGTIL
jgi:hypothetical protein